MPAPRPSASGSKLVRRPDDDDDGDVDDDDEEEEEEGEETGEVESGDDECGVFDGVFWHPEVTSAS